MQAATRRNLAFLALGLVFLLLLWQVPGRAAHTPPPNAGVLTPQPTPTVESQWRLIRQVQGQGSHDLCAEGWEVTVPGPWRVRATPADRTVQVRIFDKATGRLFSSVWASGPDHGDLATLPQANGTYCLQIEAQGDYTLYVEAWEAPQQ